jgi:hypothetical protein
MTDQTYTEADRTDGLEPDTADQNHAPASTTG